MKIIKLVYWKKIIKIINFKHSFFMSIQINLIKKIIIKMRIKIRIRIRNLKLNLII